MEVDVISLQRSLKIYKGLVEVSSLINAITEFDELLSSILEVAKRVMDVEASSLFLVNANHDLEIVIAHGRDGKSEKLNITVPRGKGISGWVLENRKSVLVEDAYSDPRFYADVDKQSGFRTRSLLCVPLVRDDKEIGVLQLLNPVGKKMFDHGDLEAFEAYGNLIATAIDKLRSLERQRQQAQLERELHFATEIQNSFLPQTLPQETEMCFASYYNPAQI